MTHDELVEIGAKWLRSKYPIVITEMTTVGEEPDAIGLRTSDTALVEAKANRADFLRDRKKVYREHMPDSGMGNYRYYIAPKGLIKPDELLKDWGLIEVSEEGKTRVKVRARYQQRKAVCELMLMISAMRRLGVKEGEGVSVKCYTHQTKCRASISIEPEGAA